MAVGGIGGNGGSPSALLALRLALRQGQPGAGAPASGEAEAPAAAAPATPDATLQAVVAKAQFTASIRVAQTAVEQAGVVAQSYDPASATPA